MSKTIFIKYPDTTTTPLMESDEEILKRKVESAKNITNVYKNNMDKPVAIREGLVLKEQFPAMCAAPKYYDLFVGRTFFSPLVAHGLELYFNRGMKAITVDDKADDQVDEETKRLRSRLGTSFSGFSYDYQCLKEYTNTLPEDSYEVKEIQDIIDFWWEESTRSKYMKSLPEELKSELGRVEFDVHLMSVFVRLGCVSANFDRLISIGVDGMIKKINTEKENHKDEDQSLYNGMLLALEMFQNVCDYYIQTINQYISIEKHSYNIEQLKEMAQVLENIKHKKPETLREGIQLFCLYNSLLGSLNYGRMDEYLGDLYCKDIDNGTLSKEDAVELFKSLFRIISELYYDGYFNARANTRIIVGGRGRRNEINADRVTLAIMEASRQIKVAEPNVTLRFYKRQDEKLFEKAIDMIGEGCIHPGLYNDDAYIPWVEEAFRVGTQDAEKYIPEGCGEIALNGISIGSPNTILLFVAALDLVLHNGYNTVLKEQKGLKLGKLSEFDTFEKLLDAFTNQLESNYETAIKRHRLEIDAEAKNSPYLLMSMLTDDCIKRNRSLMDKGAKYIGGIIETFGLTNVSDSLYAIKKLVYDDKVMTLEKLVEILDNNFEGYENERELMLSLPKYGNDIDEIDELYCRINDIVTNIPHNLAPKYGFDYFLNCNLNTGGIRYGENVKASADGRLYGDPFSVGNAPTAGRDKSGLTALLNSMSKHSKLHAGYAHNVKISKKMFTPENRPKIAALLKAYFDNGGIQSMITVLNKGDLEDALVHPEKHPNLLVRVGGWTARYIELTDRYKKEILDRYFYE